MDENNGQQLVVNGLSLKYGEENQWVLDKCNFSVRGGEVLGILGNNGSGKSSLAYGLIGIVPELIPGEVRGQIRLGHVVLNNHKLSDRLSFIGYSFQDVETQILFGTVSDVLGLSERNTNRELIKAGVEILGVQELLDREPDQLSTGEAQKIAVLSTLRTGPNVIIFDEAASNLDYHAKQAFGSLVKDLASRNISIILLAQRYKLLRPYTSLIFSLTAGKLVKSSNFRQTDLETSLVFNNENATSPPPIKIENLVIKRRRETTTFKVGPLSFSLVPGEVIALLGSNGSGKTTLLDALYGLINPASGNFVIGGKTSKNASGDLWKKNVIMVQQSPLAEFTNNDLEMELHWDDINHQSAKSILESFPFIDIRADPLELSFGQQRIINLINGIYNKKSIVLIDELEQGLDSSNLDKVMSWLKWNKESRAKTILFSTHDFDLAAEIADKCLILGKDGLLVELAKATKEELTLRYLQANDSL